MLKKQDKLGQIVKILKFFRLSNIETLCPSKSFHATNHMEAIEGVIVPQTISKRSACRTIKLAITEVTVIKSCGLLTLEENIRPTLATIDSLPTLAVTHSQHLKYLRHGFGSWQAVRRHRIPCHIHICQLPTWQSTLQHPTKANLTSSSSMKVQQCSIHGHYSWAPVRTFSRMPRKSAAMPYPTSTGNPNMKMNQSQQPRSLSSNDSPNPNGQKAVKRGKTKNSKHKQT